ncbi:hypothetical protein [uncultured Fibrobacter sp.]|uniref:hypothetical protein n=1 Tax=uncultured Fibrobacter sp. TaxID=261512 RepID=UPI0025F3B86C|nr:hypothetical protein [uncultured Fibrobacter sp.]
MNSKLVCISLASLVALAVLWGCASNEATVQTQPSVAQAPKVPVSQELNAIACSEGELRGSGLAGGYDQALSYAVSQIATQIQSSVVSTSVMQTRSDVSASGNEEISSSFDRKSQVQAEIRNRQDVHVRETIAHDGVVGVVACMSRADAAKPFREDYLGARDALVAAVAVLSVTSHPLDKFGSYEKVTAAYSKYRAALQVLSSLGFNETSAEVEDGYAKAVENYIGFRSKYKVYIDGAFESEEGKILFEQISGDVKLQSREDSCDVGLVLELEISAPSCKEGALGVSCTEVVALNGKSCKGETYFTLGGTLKGIGRSDENEAKAKLLKSASKNDFVADWKKEISRWFAR